MAGTSGSDIAKHIIEHEILGIKPNPTALDLTDLEDRVEVLENQVIVIDNQVIVIEGDITNIENSIDVVEENLETFIQDTPIILLDDGENGEELPLYIEGEGDDRDIIYLPTEISGNTENQIVTITALSLSSGNHTLTDIINWATAKSYISAINVQTNSTDWDLWLCFDNTFNTGDVRSIQLVNQGYKTTLVDPDLNHISIDNNLYIIYTGAQTADFYFIGEIRE